MKNPPVLRRDCSHTLTRPVWDWHDQETVPVPYMECLGYWTVLLKYTDLHLYGLEELNFRLLQDPMYFQNFRSVLREGELSVQFGLAVTKLR